MNKWVKAVLILAVSVGAGLMAIQARGATPGDKAPKARYGAVQILSTAATKVFTGLVGRNAFNVQNRGPNSIYCGWDTLVTTTTGTEIVAGASISVDMVYNAAGDQDFYCRAATADQTSPGDTRWIQVK